MDYDFWLFDLDGTLVDIEPAYIRSVFDGIGDRLGHGFSDREAEAIWYDLAGTGATILAERGIGRRKFWEVFHAVEDPIARAESTYLYDDAAVVGALDEPVGLVTHCQRYLAEPAIEALDIADWFDVVVCCDEEIGWKPDPAPLRRAMDELGVATGDGTGGDDEGGGNSEAGGERKRGRGRGVLVGDSAADIGAAWNAGLDAVHVERHGHEKRGGCVLGDYRVERLTDLPLSAPNRVRSPRGRQAGD